MNYSSSECFPATLPTVSRHSSYFITTCKTELRPWPLTSYYLQIYLLLTCFCFVLLFCNCQASFVSSQCRKSSQQGASQTYSQASQILLSIFPPVPRKIVTSQLIFLSLEAVTVCRSDPPPPLECLPEVLLALVCFQYQFLMNCLWLVICQLIMEQSTCSVCCLGTLPFV